MRQFLLVLLIVAPLASAAPAAAQQPSTTRDSVSSSGAQSTGNSLTADVPASGRVVVFASNAANLVTGDANATTDIFVHDRSTGQTRRLNLAPGGTEANAISAAPTITADGATVLFRSEATNLVAPPPGGPRLYLVDVATAAVRLAPNPPPGYGTPESASISADGTRVVFTAARTAGGVVDVFAGDVGTGAVRRVSETGAGVGGDDNSREPAVSDNGDWVAFRTAAANLTPNDTNGFRDIVVAGLESGVLERASVPSGPPTTTANSHSSGPVVSDDGCKVAFRSDARNLVSPDIGAGVAPIFLRDRCAQTTQVVSRTNADAVMSGSHPDISADGCLVSYASVNATPPPATGSAAFLRDRCNGGTFRLDLATTGEAGTGGVGVASDFTDSGVAIRLSPGTGRYATFETAGTGLVPGDTNGTFDVFVRDRAVNAKPVPDLTVGVDGRTVTADALASRDPDGATVTGSIAWGDGTTNATGLRAQHVYARGGTFAVTVTVTDADGASASKAVPVTLPEPAAAPSVPASTPGAPPPPTSPKTVERVVLAGVKLSRKRWSVVAKGRRVKGRRGTKLRLGIDVDARVRIRVQRASAGRREGRRCVSHRKTGRRCVRWSTVATVTRALAAGSRSVALTGRFGHKKLKPGKHRLRVDATSPGRLPSSVKTLPFTVIK